MGAHGCMQSEEGNADNVMQVVPMIGLWGLVYVAFSSWTVP